MALTLMDVTFVQMGIITVAVDFVPMDNMDAQVEEIFVRMEATTVLVAFARMDITAVKLQKCSGFWPLLLPTSFIEVWV